MLSGLDSDGIILAFPFSKRFILVLGISRKLKSLWTEIFRKDLGPDIYALNRRWP